MLAAENNASDQPQECTKKPNPDNGVGLENLGLKLSVGQSLLLGQDPEGVDDRSETKGQKQESDVNYEVHSSTLFQENEHRWKEDGEEDINNRHAIIVTAQQPRTSR